MTGGEFPRPAAVRTLQPQNAVGPTAQDVIDGLHTEASRTGEGTTEGARRAARALLRKYYQ